MGLRGPIAKPERFKVLAGTSRKDRKKRTAADVARKTRRTTPSPPDWLDAEAKREWRRIIKVLGERGLLDGLDRALLASYCSYWSQFVSASKSIRNLKGKLTQETTGGRTPHALLKVRDTAAAQLERLARHFGLSPATRARLNVQDDDDDDGSDLLR